MENDTNGNSKIVRYNWKLKDEVGTFMYIDKKSICINENYQRDANVAKTNELASSWSWMACGVIIVAERCGIYWAIDGQHRVIASLKRSDIQEMPCMVFKTTTEMEEALGFLSANTNRKPISSTAKFKAMIAAGDENAIFVNKLLETLGIRIISHGTAKPKTVKSIAGILRLAKESRENITEVMHLADEICIDYPIYEILIGGLAYINENVEGGLKDKRLRSRIIKIGGKSLVDGAKKAAAYYVRGGNAVWADGMMSAINSGLQQRFTLAREK